MNACIVYCSRTGNTQKVAEALARATHFPAYRTGQCPDLSPFRLVLLGFRVVRGLPDEPMLAVMRAIHEKTVFCFCTHAAWPGSEHIRNCLAQVTAILEKGANTVIGSYTCQGRVHGHIMHPMTPEREARLAEAARHPSEDDLRAAVAAFSRAMGASVAGT